MTTPAESVTEALRKIAEGVVPNPQHYAAVTLAHLEANKPPAQPATVNGLPLYLDESVPPGDVVLVTISRPDFDHHIAKCNPTWFKILTHEVMKEPLNPDEYRVVVDFIEIRKADVDEFLPGALRRAFGEDSFRIR